VRNQSSDEFANHEEKANATDEEQLLHGPLAVFLGCLELPAFLKGAFLLEALFLDGG
jgi:hypothetical protein